jgi:SHS2 domain-containing protein
MENYILLEHPGDLKIRAFGDTVEEMFVNAAMGMQSVLFEVTPKDDDKYLPVEKIIVQSSSLETLLVDWLSKLLFIVLTRYGRATDIQLRISGAYQLNADVRLVPQAAKDDIKAITHHDLNIKHANDKWLCEYTLDV